MKILFVATQFPLPADTGGRIRSFNLIKHLSHQHQLSFVCSVDVGTPQETLKTMEQNCFRFVAVPTRQTSERNWIYYLRLAANFLSPTPFGVAKDYSPLLARRIRGLLETDDFDVVVCDFLHTSVNLQRINATPTIMFQHNVEAEIFRRYYLQQRNWLTKLFWLYHWKKMQRYERSVSRGVDCCVAVSAEDQLTFERDYGLTNVASIDTGVDVKHFAGVRIGQVPNRLVFTGSMDWLPNEDAVLWFVQNIFSRIRRVVPDVSFSVVGRRPSNRVKGLAASIPGIQVTGRVEDIRPYLAESSVFVVPIRIGGGTRIKIFEAMASGLPVVSTPIGAEGLRVDHGRHILLAEKAEGFAESVIQLLRNPDLACRLARDARSLVAGHDWERIAQQFGDICSRTARVRQTIG